MAPFRIPPCPRLKDTDTDLGNEDDGDTKQAS